MKMPDQLNGAFNAMATATGSDPDRMPGLVTVSTKDWVNSLADLRTPRAALHDGFGYRDGVVHVASHPMTTVLTRSETGERGRPFVICRRGFETTKAPSGEPEGASRAKPWARPAQGSSGLLETCRRACSGRVGRIATGDLCSQSGLGLA